MKPISSYRNGGIILRWRCSKDPAKEEESLSVLQPLVILGEAGNPFLSEVLETEEKKDAPEN